MDQRAFRQLISSNKGSDFSSVSVAEKPPAQASGRNFGRAPKRKIPSSAGVASSSSDSVRLPDLQPRKLKSSSSSAENFDRAQAHIQGGRTEHGTLHDDHTRASPAETEPKRRQRHDQPQNTDDRPEQSVPAKGLDFSLLAKKKAELARQRPEAQETDDDEAALESAFEQSKRLHDRHDDDDAVQPAEQDGEHGTRKRSRAEIIEALKRRTQQSLEESSDTSKPTLGKGFRPIGSKPVNTPSTAVSTEEPDADYKWVNGRRMRKKKKLPGATASPTLALTPVDRTSPASPIKPSTSSMSGGKKERISGKAAKVSSNLDASTGSPKGVAQSKLGLESEPSTAITTPPRTEQATEVKPPSPVRLEADNNDNEVDEDEDIFADVGGWTGLAEAEEDEEDNEQHEQSTHPADLDADATVQQPHLDNISSADPSTSVALTAVTGSETHHSTPEPSAFRADEVGQKLDVSVDVDPPFAASVVDVVTPSITNEQESALLPAPTTKPARSKWQDDDDDVLRHNRKSKKKKSSRK